MLRTTFPKGRAEKRRFLQRETTPFARYSGFREDRVFYDESGLCIQHNGGRSEQNGRRSVNSVGAARSVPGCVWQCHSKGVARTHLTPKQERASRKFLQKVPLSATKMVPDQLRAGAELFLINVSGWSSAVFTTLEVIKPHTNWPPMACEAQTGAWRGPQNYICSKIRKPSGILCHPL